ncbi:exodeoxyribonuclease III [Haloglycomyces albus]|uniref:exodeoxyribonuclease III n=1 Tax=Haloglycomyces albus TaxID=526067 RepID=UPI00046D9320|nr:exodeoxyribonuclease III [Haloglycomyces albus]
MFTVATVNVNGIRAAAKKGMVDWLTTVDADVVLLQEVRAEDHQIPSIIREAGQWHWQVAPSQTAKGRAGVGILTRNADSEARIGFGSEEFDVAGRYMEIDLPSVTIGSLYLPSGETDTPRQDEKYRFLEQFGEYVESRRREMEAEGRHFLIGGDWNIAHTQADLKNWKGNKKSSGFLPEERAWLDRLFDERGFVDVVRRLHPDVEGPYSWWSYRGRAFDNDTGWRIDYHAVDQALAKQAVTAWVDRAPSHDTRWSDHAPVLVSYDL